MYSSDVCNWEQCKAITCCYECRHIVEFKGVGCMEPQTPESMTSSLYIVQEFMSGDTLKVQYCAFAEASVGETPFVGQHSPANTHLWQPSNLVLLWLGGGLLHVYGQLDESCFWNCPTESLQDTLFPST